MTAPFRGLTWDHPRGYRALEAAAASDPVVSWERQPLEGFESAPIADLCAHYDLVVLDHPHLGEAIAEACLAPVEGWFPAPELARVDRETIGPALSSYAWGGRHWALPLDVATQVMARDPRLVETPPDTWDEVERLSGRVPVALSLAGPHAVLNFLSLCVALGTPPGGPDLVAEATGIEAIGRMARLHARVPAGSDALNPIGLLETMASGEGIALVPLVYGYVPYATARPGRRRVAFSEAPRIAAGGRRGSVLGGTGIGLSRRARPDAALVAHLVALMSARMQTGFIPDHEGQPSSALAWTDAGVDARAGGFYGSTLETTRTAWVRPRFDGYIAWQTAASAALRQGLGRRDAAADILSGLRDLWRAARAAARGDLDDRL
jgi:multiple sugar transport system substrate-binding protein